MTKMQECFQGYLKMKRYSFPFIKKEAEINIEVNICQKYKIVERC